MRIFLITLSALTLIMCCSCSALQREPYTPSKRYELSVTSSTLNVKNHQIELNSFNNLTAINRQMMFTNADGLLTPLPFCEWAQNPDLMIQRVLMSKLGAVKSKLKMEINGDIWNFSLNFHKKVAELSVNYQILCYLNDSEKKYLSGTMNFSAPLNAKEGGAAAKAMSKCANDLADSLINVIENIK